MGQAFVDFLLERLMFFFKFRKVRLHRHQSCLLNQWAPKPDKCSSDSTQERRYTRFCAAANGTKVVDWPGFSRSLNAAVENAIIIGLCRAWLASPMQTSGGDDARQRTRVAGAVGAPAAGTSRPRRRDPRLGDVARLRRDPGAAPEEAQARAARQDPPNRRPAHSGYYCL